VLGLVRREAEEDLGGGVVDQRAWRRHGGALVVWVGIWGRSCLLGSTSPNVLCLYA
jgi:hypothetical protein